MDFIRLFLLLLLHNFVRNTKVNGRKCNAGTGISGNQCASCSPGTYQSENGVHDPVCKDCNPGYYTAQNAQASCSLCSAGQSESGKIQCLPCGLGAYKTTNGLSCTNCPQGYYSTANIASSCIPCAAGYFSTDQKRQTSCATSLCPEGYHQNEVGQLTCKSCLHGQFNPSKAQPVCQNCAAGKFSKILERVEVCDNCPTGYEQPLLGQQLCTGCGSGKYQDTEGLSSCKNCQVGKYASNLKRETECTSCSAGKYLGEESRTLESHCNICPAGFSSATSGQSTCNVCPAGQYQNESPINGNTLCKKCVAGKYRGANVDGQLPSVSRSCDGCGAGKYQNQDGQVACVLCPAGKKKGLAGITLACHNCVAGKYQDETGKLGCKKCHVGKYQNEVTGTPQCKICMIGKYQENIFQTACDDCDAGKYQNQEAGTSCKLCGAGFYENEKGKTSELCKRCVTGRYQNEKGKLECKACESAKYQNEESKNVCLDCAIGMANPGTAKSECVECNSGQYNDEVGQTQCKPCPIGTFAKDQTVGHIAILDHCSVCPNGYAAPSPGGNTECTICPKKTYLGGAEFKENGYWTVGECLACPNNPSDETGQTTCPGCSAGEFGADSNSCASCTKGTFSGGGFLVCKICPSGFHTGGLSKAPLCTKCPVGTYGVEEGLHGVENCSKCSSGKYAIVEGAASETACLNCVEGRYQTAVGANHVSLCLACSPGKTASNPGRTVDCISCPTGWYMDQPAQTTDCKICNQGYAQPEETSVSCEPCLPGLFQNAMGQDNCIECDAGKYSQSLFAVSCHNCIEGKHQHEPSASMCFTCMPGTTAPSAGAHYCTDCPVGKFMNTSEAVIDCHSCKTGQYQDEAGSFTCKICLVGRYQKFENQVACVDCPSGYFQEFPERTECNFCPSGYVQTTAKQMSCIMCLAGRYEPNNASPFDCKICPSGYVQPLSKQITCKMCLAGYSSPKPEQTICNVCPAGRFEPYNASIKPCEPCSLHTYTAVEGEAKCLSCPAGYKRGGTECAACGAGKYGTTVDSRKNTTDGSCLFCPAGQYRSGLVVSESLTTCVSCSVGYHQPVNGSSSCLPCIPGRYNNKLEQLNCAPCPVNYFASEINSTSCTYCLPGTFTNGRDSSASCQPCPAGTAGAGCVPCLQGMYRGNTDDAKTCLKCKTGLHSSDLGSPFCLDCDAGKYAAVTGLRVCVQCAPGKYESEKRAKLPCNKCLNDLVPNAKQTACEVVPIDSDAAIAQLVSIHAATKDAKSLKLTYRLSMASESGSMAVIRSADTLELQTSLRTDFKYTYKTKFIALPPSRTKSSVLFSFVVDPPIDAMSNDGIVEIPKYGSVWNQLVYFRVRVVNEQGGEIRRGLFSTRNDAWTIASVCGDYGYLQTHKNNNLMESPLKIFSVENSKDELVPTCKICPEGANCRGSRTFAQVVARDGFHVLPWDASEYGKCPRQAACVGNDDTLALPKIKSEEDGGNSSQTILPCHPAHQGILCGECKFYHDTAIGDPLGVCFPCPDQTENLLKIVAVGLGAIGMLSFLVRDSLAGVNEILVDHMNGEDASVPFHSVGIRIISSFMQLAGLLYNFRLDLPAPVVSLMTMQSSVSGVGGSALSFNCILPNQRGHELFMTKLICIIIIIPLSLSLCVCLFWAAVSLLRKICRTKDDKHVTPFDKAVGSVIIMYYIMFPSILNGMTDAMSCTTYGPKTSDMARVLLDSSLGIICYQNEHLMILLLVVVPSFFLFICFVPLAIVYSMRVHHKKLSLLPHQKHFNPVACYRYGFLFLGYEEEWYGWELLVMMRKAAFVVITGLLRPYGPVSQITGACTILIVALSVHLQYRPYDSDGHDSMESMSLHSSLVILMSTLLCSMVGRNLEGKLGPVASIVLVILFFSATLLFFFIAFMHICKHSHDQDGMLGKIARVLTKKTHNDRRHSIHNRHVGHVQRGKTGQNLVAVLPSKTITKINPESSKDIGEETKNVLSPGNLKNWSVNESNSDQTMQSSREEKKTNDVKRRESRRYRVSTTTIGIGDKGHI